MQEGIMSYKFYQNKSCEYFPCHATDCPEKFSCIFCYCPLYALGDKCGGNFSYTEKGIKDCSACLIPHREKNYEYMTDKCGLVMEMVRKKTQ
ncbi:MAG: metal-binding protein [Eubacteriaceae bacterium]|nr:metal-binding protein [Eubacteriaceae bacterium]